MTPVITYVMDPEMEEEVERMLALVRESRERREGGGESRDDVLPLPVFANTNDGVEHDDDVETEDDVEHDDDMDTDDDDDDDGDDDGDDDDDDHTETEDDVEEVVGGGGEGQ